MLEGRRSAFRTHLQLGSKAPADQARAPNHGRDHVGTLVGSAPTARSAPGCRLPRRGSTDGDPTSWALPQFSTTDVVDALRAARIRILGDLQRPPIPPLLLRYGVDGGARAESAYPRSAMVAAVTALVGRPPSSISWLVARMITRGSSGSCSLRSQRRSSEKRSARCSSFAPPWIASNVSTPHHAANRPPSDIDGAGERHRRPRSRRSDARRPLSATAVRKRPRASRAAWTPC